MTELRIIKTNETKSMIDFQECYSGLNICLMKSNLIIAYQLFKNWLNNQYADNFHSELFRLACHADDHNKYRLLVGFPEEMVVYLLWYTSKNQDDFFKFFENINEE